MADTTTELEVLDEIVDVLGGQSGQYETVVPTLQQIRDLLGGGGGGGGYNPALSVGRADALTGADSTAQWATRESTGSGAATVRSVQGATEAQDGELVPVRIAGIRSTGFNLLNVQRDVVITNANAAEYSDGSNRKFAENQMWVGMTMNNIMSSSAISSYEVGEEAVTVTSTNSGYGITFPVQAIPNAQYYIGSESSSDALFGIGLYDAAGGFIAFRPASGTAAVGFVFSTTEDTHWLTVCMRPTRDVTTTYNRPILNLSDTERNGTYEPYHIVDAIEWPTQTLRAAGSVRDELTSGELVTRVGVVVIDGVNVKAYGTYTISGVIHGLVDMGSGAMANQASQVLISCDKLPAMSGNQEWVATLGIAIGSDKFIRFVTPEIAEATSAGDLNAWLQQNPLTCFYAIATPTTTPISPALDMTYRVQAGGSEFIIVPDGEISAAPVLTVAEGESAGELVMDALACIATPDGPVATANHAVNTYLTMQGKLYKVTTAIASGEQIVSGANVTETTVMAELLALAN